MLFGTAFTGPAHTQELDADNKAAPAAPKAAPVTEVITETEEGKKDTANTPATAPQPKAQTAVFIELFSSQACLFCPQADRLFADLLQQSDIFGFACHVDYFKTRGDRLARPFCTDRQKWYMQTLKTGPQYTPQMIINGQHDVIGYKIDEVMATLEQARQNRFFMLNIVPSVSEKGAYDFILPAITVADTSDLQIWLALYDKPHDLTIADGRNRGKAMQYVNIASNLGFLGPWDGTMASRQIRPDFKERHGGFIVLVQDQNNGQIVAAGRYDITGKI